MRVRQRPWQDWIESSSSFHPGCICLSSGLRWKFESHFTSNGWAAHSCAKIKEQTILYFSGGQRDILELLLTEYQNAQELYLNIDITLLHILVFSLNTMKI